MFCRLCFLSIYFIFILETSRRLTCRSGFSSCWWCASSAASTSRWGEEKGPLVPAHVTEVSEGHDQSEQWFRRQYSKEKSFWDNVQKTLTFFGNVFSSEVRLLTFPVKNFFHITNLVKFYTLILHFYRDCTFNGFVNIIAA